MEINLPAIARGWYNYAYGSEEIKQMMKSRLLVCNSCEHRQQMNQLGQLLVSSVHAEGSIYKCGHCHCPLAARTSDPKSSCPLGKWLAVQFDI